VLSAVSCSKVAYQSQFSRQLVPDPWTGDVERLDTKPDPRATFLKLLRKILGRFLILGKSYRKIFGNALISN